MTDLRSRNGCATCRKRRRKCDEVRPTCGGCQKRHLTCEYSVRVRWTATNKNLSGQKRRRVTVNQESSRSQAVPRSPPKFEFPTVPLDTFEPEDIVSNECAQVEGDISQAPQYVTLSDLGDNDNIDPRDDESVDDGSSEGWVLEEELDGQFSQDDFSTPGEYIAFVYWVKYLSGVLPAYDSASNPYRRLSKLALASPVLLNTIISLATEYMYCHGHAAPELTLQRHDRALGSLRDALVSASSPASQASPGFGDNRTHLDPKQATLAAVLLQIANVVFTGGTGVEVHLACAMHFLQDLDYVSQPVDDFLPRLLVQRFAMLDVIMAILKHRRPHLPLDFWLFIPDVKYDRTEPSFREMTGCPQPVLGFFARLANLSADLDDHSREEFDVLTKASTLETDMRIYARSRVTFSSSRTTTASHLDTLSQCFYWSAHLILQRLIYRDPTGSSRVQQTVMNIVKLIKSMPIGCGPDSSLPFPFYISSREAVTSEHRDWVKERNHQMKQVYPGRSRDALMALLEEIWAAVDDGREVRETLNKDNDTTIRTLEQRRDFCLF